MIQNGSTAEIEGPGMERTSEARAGNDTVGQRTTTMRAVVIDGDEGVAKIEDGDPTTGNFYRFSLAHGNSFAAGDANPTGFPTTHGTFSND